MVVIFASSRLHTRSSACGGAGQRAISEREPTLRPQAPRTWRSPPGWSPGALRVGVQPGLL